MAAELLASTEPFYPGSKYPTDRAESFNGRMRDELLNKTLFTSLAHAREVVAFWADDYNAERPHSILGCVFR